MKLDIRDLPKFLDENLELHKKGKKAKNLYFLCRHDLIVDDVIKEWFKKQSINFLQDAYPRELFEQNKQGFLVKKEPSIYVLQSALQNKMESPFVLYYRMLNYGRDFNGDHMIIDFIAKDAVPNASFKPFDLKNRMFTIAFGFKEDSGNRISPLNKDLLDLFDIYELEVDLRFLLEHEYKRKLELINRLESQTGVEIERITKEARQDASNIRQLIDTGFNIPDCGVYLLNSISGANVLSEDGTFEDFKKELIKQVEASLDLHKYGKAVTTDKIKADYLSILEWLKSIK